MSVRLEISAINVWIQVKKNLLWKHQNCLEIREPNKYIYSYVPGVYTNGGAGFLKQLNTLKLFVLHMSTKMVIA